MACGIELWRAAARWRRRVETSLAPHGLTLTQWVILAATDTVIRETTPAASQNAAAACAHVDKMTTSQVMKALESRGFIDRAPAAQGPAFRVWITRRGMQALNKGTMRVREASRASFNGLEPLDARLLVMLRKIV
jgi:DNA-binding MarR family transcriptional regulator